jgi:hypothetical protein
MHLPGGRVNKPTEPAERVNERGKRVALVDDDGKTLWVSPTKGSPLDLAYLPPGCQIIASLRTSDLRDAEKFKVLLSLGPLGINGLKRLASNGIGNRDDWLTLPPMLVGLQVNSAGHWSMSRRVNLQEPYTDAMTKEWLKSFEPSVETHRSQPYGLVGEIAFYLPPTNDKLVIAPKNLIKEIIDLNGSPPPLRRDMERLVAHTDSDRHLTILFAPPSLFTEGQSMFRGEMARLREPLFWFLGDEFSAVALSLHWDENFFIELMATPTLDTSPEKAARILMERLAQVPGKLEKYLAGLEPEPYGREILARFPAMVRTMVTYTRSGFEPDHAVLRCYLPAAAGHNLLMGAELTLAEAAGGGRPVAETTSPSGVTEVVTESVRERLRRRTSLRFARDTLEAALEQLSEEIGVEIVIVNRPAEGILVEILRLANPDKSATAPNDERQKLVYVVAAGGPDEMEQVLVTTRAAAAARGNELPQVFRIVAP